MADLTAYNDKHNEANGEDNNDGESYNRSWNCGAEGPTDDPAILELRDRQRRNLLGTLLLSAGVPMILGGDEIGRTQRGNNNAYCQDNEVSWYDWENVDEDLLAFHQDGDRATPGQPSAAAPRVPARPRGRPGADGPLPSRRQANEHRRLAGPPCRALAVALDGRQIEDADGETTDDRFLLLLNAHHEPVKFTVPPGPDAWERRPHHRRAR